MPDVSSYLVAASSATQMYSGVGRVLFDWMRFAQRHFDVSMLLDLADRDNFRTAATFCRAQGIPLHVSPTARRPGTPDTGLGGAADILSAPWGFVEIVSWASAGASLDVMATRQAATRLVFTPHTQPLATLPDPAAQFLVSPTFDVVMDAADLVCCTSPAEHTMLRARYGARSSLQLIPNGVDADLFHPDGLPRGNAVLAVFDAREARKRPDLLWQAFTVASRGDDQLQLVLAGQETERLTPPEHLRGRVTTMGYVTQQSLLQLYRSARCLVLLSDFEAFGLPVSEALMCGTPVVITGGDQQRSLFGGLPGVELVDNTDAEAAGAAIRRAAQPAATARISDAARHRFGLAASCERKLEALRALPALSAGHCRNEVRPSPVRPQGVGNAVSRRSKTGLLRVLQVTPGYFAEASLLGGGERYVENVCRSLAVADAEAECTVVSFGPKSDRFRSSVGTRYEIVRGDPEAPNTIDTGALQALLSRADVVHMHQCLSSAGMFVASHARLLGRPVIGSDHGGGVMPALHAQPRLAGIYDVLLAYSAFGETAFLDVDVPVRRIHGPVDDAQFIPARQGTRDRSLVITVGRILPHKGLHHVIAALPPGLSLIVAGRAYDPAYRGHLAQLAQGDRSRSSRTWTTPGCCA